jgi:hypothetical protein
MLEPRGSFGVNSRAAKALRLVVSVVNEQNAHASKCGLNKLRGSANSESAGGWLAR